MVTIGYRKNSTVPTSNGQIYYSITSTDYTSDISDTDTSSHYYGSDVEYEKSKTEEKMEYKMMKELLQIPSFNIVKNLHNNKKINTILYNKQKNFNIRNAL